MEKHPIEPFYCPDSEILILGSFPSVLSRRDGFYYAHPKNRFWRVLSTVFEDELPKSISDKKKFLKRHKLALFDVCKSCDIHASSDASIKNVEPNDLSDILKHSNIHHIAVNGKTAYQLYNKFIKNVIGIDAIYLSSTSPANATYTFDHLVEEYSVLTRL